MELLKKYWREVLIGLLAVLLIFSVKGCGQEESIKVTVKDKEVIVPGSDGVFTKPKSQTELPSKGVDSIIYRNNIIYSTHPLDKELAERLKNAKDSLEVMKIAIEASQERENVTYFSDDKLDLKVHTIVQGQLKDVKINYKIEPQTITIQEKIIEKTVIQKDNFGLLVTGKYNYTLDPANPSSLEVGGGIRVKKVSLLGTINTNKQLGIGTVIEF